MPILLIIWGALAGAVLALVAAVFGAGIYRLNDWSWSAQDTEAIVMIGSAAGAALAIVVMAGLLFVSED